MLSVLVYENGRNGPRLRPIRVSKGEESLDGMEGHVTGPELYYRSTTSRSISTGSISSEGSSEMQLVEQEDIISLTQEVRSFKDVLGKLRKLYHPERDKRDIVKVAAHEKLGDILRSLRNILERYPPIQSTELLMAAGILIQQVKGFNYLDARVDTAEILESIDQLALTFSSRVSEFLMGDLENFSSHVTSAAKSKSCDQLSSQVGDCSLLTRCDGTLTCQQADNILLRLEQGVELALHHAKAWSKYAKDLLNYIEKRTVLENDYAKNLAKLAQFLRPQLKEESCLPFQSIYCTAVDYDLENVNNTTTANTLLQGPKFLEPLAARRAEHERIRKHLKETWLKEMKRMQDAVSNLRKAKANYLLKKQEYLRAKDAVTRAEMSGDLMESSRVEKKKKFEDEAMQKALEAESTYRACVNEANERHTMLQSVKAEVLQQVRELIQQCDQTLKAATVSYFQLQHSSSAAVPVQFQTLCESSRLYEPGSQYLEFVRRVPYPRVDKNNTSLPYLFEPYHEPIQLSSEPNRKSLDSLTSNDESSLLESGKKPLKAWLYTLQHASDTESVTSSHSNPSQDTSPAASPIPCRKTLYGNYSDLIADQTFSSSHQSSIRKSKAAITHTFRKLKTPSRCRECDSYVYFQGAECSQCGLACHKRCLENLAIQCGHKRLPRKMTTFGVDITQHLQETHTPIPPLVYKCVAEIDKRGTKVKGIYRVSGVKSRVEKLSQSFENGSDLVDLSDVHPNVISNVLKLYLRQLPEPLLTFNLYNDFIRVARDYGDDVTMAVEELKNLCARLPRTMFQTLNVLMHHLKRVAEEHECNNMPASNLGIVFGPTLLRVSEGSATLNYLIDTVYQTRTVELFILYAQYIFGSDEWCPALLHMQLFRSKSSSPNKTPAISSNSNNGNEMERIDSQIISFTSLRQPISVNQSPELPGYIGPQVQTSLLVTEEVQNSDDDYPEVALPDDSMPMGSPLIPRSNDNRLHIAPGQRVGRIRPCTILEAEVDSEAKKSNQGSLGSDENSARVSCVSPVKIPIFHTSSESFGDSDCCFDSESSVRCMDLTLNRSDRAPISVIDSTTTSRDSSFDSCNFFIGRGVSLDNLTSSESSQDIDSVHTPDDWQSSELNSEEVLEINLAASEVASNLLLAEATYNLEKLQVMNKQRCKVQSGEKSESDDTSPSLHSCHRAGNKVHQSVTSGSSNIHSQHTNDTGEEFV